MDIEDLHPVPIHFSMKVYEGTNLNKHVPVLFLKDGVTLVFFFDSLLLFPALHE